MVHSPAALPREKQALQLPSRKAAHRAPRQASQAYGGECLVDAGMLGGRYGAECTDARPQPLHHHISAGNREGTIQSGQLRQQGDACLTLMRDAPRFRLLQPSQGAQ